MAKRQKANPDKFIPGVIYYLVYTQYDEDVPFYVGESINPNVRKNQHIQSTQTEEQRLVYEKTKELNSKNIEWDLVVVEHYDDEGPKDKEDRHIMDLLRAGFKLTNMKKGNTNWMANLEAEAADMNAKGYIDPKQYRKDKAEWDAAAEKEKADKKHQHWLEIEEELKISKDRLEQLQLSNECRKVKLFCRLQEMKKTLPKMAAEIEESVFYKNTFYEYKNATKAQREDTHCEHENYRDTTWITPFLAKVRSTDNAVREEVEYLEAHECEIENFEEVKKQCQTLWKNNGDLI